MVSTCPSSEPVSPPVESASSPEAFSSFPWESVPEGEFEFPPQPVSRAAAITDAINTETIFLFIVFPLFLFYFYFRRFRPAHSFSMLFFANGVSFCRHRNHRIASKRYQVEIIYHYIFLANCFMMLWQIYHYWAKMSIEKAGS